MATSTRSEAPGREPEASETSTTQANDIQGEIKRQRLAPGDASPVVSFTLLTKDNGPLTKIIRPDGKGGIEKNASECRMSSGTAETVTLPFSEFGPHLRTLKHNQAIAHGVTDRDGPVRVVNKDRLSENPGAVARTKDFFRYSEEGPALAMFDYDPKDGQPRLTPEQFIDIASADLPGFRGAAKVITESTSSCIYKNGQQLTGHAGGFHLYFLVQDPADLERFTKVLFKRLWLAGLGYIFITKSGEQHPRTIFDEYVFSPERLVFEADALCEGGLTQARPDPEYIPGDVLDTTLLLGLTADEEAEFERRVAAEKERSRPQAEAVRQEYLAREAEKLAKARGISEAVALEVVDRRLSGQSLHPDDVLYFDVLGAVTVREVLDDPLTYDNKQLADPLEPEYGKGKAMFYANEPDGVPTIHSYAHGGRNFYLPDLDKMFPAVPGTDATTGTAWPPILPWENPNRPAFPVQALSLWLRDFAAAAAESYQVPVDAAAVASLGVVSLSAARVFEVEVKPDWVETTNLYTCVVLPSGERKSAILSEVMKPVRDYERQHADAMRPLIARAKHRKDAAQARVEALKKKSVTF